jgi:hypothetical protein
VETLSGEEQAALGARVAAEAIKRAGIEPSEVGHVVFGNEAGRRLDPGEAARVRMPGALLAKAVTRPLPERVAGSQPSRHRRDQSNGWARLTMSSTSWRLRAKRLSTSGSCPGTM